MVTTDTNLALDDIARLAVRFAVPIEDALLIAVNLYGISSDHNRHRARVTVRLTSEPDVSWMVIVPLNAHGSPFTLRGEELFVGQELIGEVRRIDADEAVGGYFRDGGRAATLNPNARSRCVGCAFCPNTLEAVVPGALAALRTMSQYATLVTLSNVTCVEAGTGQLRDQLMPWVSDHFPSCRIGYAKPDPAAFESVAHACGTKTSAMVHIGDDWECDIVGAISVGATAIWISNRRPVPDDQLVVDSGVLVAADLAAASQLVSDLATRRRS